MGWKDLLQQQNERITLPWTGGRKLRSANREYTIKGTLPAEFGWYVFSTSARNATLIESSELEEVFTSFVKGYLVGNRLISDNVRVTSNPVQIVAQSETVHLIEPGLDRFVRVQAGRVYEDGPLIYRGLDMPLGSEEDVLNAFLEERASVSDIRNVTPSLDAAFRMETFQRAEAKRRREELERLRLEEEARLEQEARRQKLMETVGTAQGRRELAIVDFEQAARAALAITGAVYLDHRNSPRRNEKVVRFRFMNRRFECVCDQNMRIIDAGICLTSHDTGEKGDDRFSLESLPSVIREAIEDDVLVVFRHVN